MQNDVARGAGAGIIAVVALAALAGCASTEAGFGLPTLETADAETAISTGSAEPGSLTGALHVESNGCFTWTAANDTDEADGAWIIWPAGGRQDGDAVVLGSGARVGEGGDLEAVGAVVALDDLPQGENHDSYYVSFGEYCGADERGVLVLTEAVDG